MGNNDDLKVEPTKDGYEVKTGPLSWEDAQRRRREIKSLPAIEKQNKEMREFLKVTLMALFIASLIVGYLIALYITK
jgi:hypothetical protein